MAQINTSDCHNNENSKIIQVSFKPHAAQLRITLLSCLCVEGAQTGIEVGVVPTCTCNMVPKTRFR